MEEKASALSPELVNAFVIAGHHDIQRVQELLQETPQFANAAWDWGGDWETALGGASHMGRRDIAQYLLAHGARIDIFAAAMLGDIEIVRAALEAYPNIQEITGPHNIPLIEHARKGGGHALDVLAYLESKRNAQ
jgi:hypothetical protein